MKIRTILYRGFKYYVDTRKDGFYHLTVGIEPSEAEDDDWNGPFQDQSDAVSDAAERIDLAMA